MSFHRRILCITVIFSGLYGCATTPSGGQIYIPNGQGPFPAILVLHTSGGLTRYEKIYARKLSGEGFVATAIKSSDSATETYDYLASLPHVDPNRIGVVGFSRGAVSALALASRQSTLHGAKPIAGVVSYYIGFSIVPWVESVEHPPVLFLHGSKDIYLKPQEIIDYCQSIRNKNSICEYEIYDGAGHAFDRDSIYDNFNSVAAKSAWERAVVFLNKHVKGEN